MKQEEEREGRNVKASRRLANPLPGDTLRICGFVHRYTHMPALLLVLFLNFIVRLLLVPLLLLYIYFRVDGVAVNIVPFLLCLVFNVLILLIYIHQFLLSCLLRLVFIFCICSHPSTFPILLPLPPPSHRPSILLDCSISIR